MWHKVPTCRSLIQTSEIYRAVKEVWSIQVRHTYYIHIQQQTPEHKAQIAVEVLEKKKKSKTKPKQQQQKEPKNKQTKNPSKTKTKIRLEFVSQGSYGYFKPLVNMTWGIWPDFKVWPRRLDQYWYPNIPPIL